jgi:lysozyme
MSRIRTGGANLALLACTTLTGFEGYRLTAYPDPATHGPPWTACAGVTKGIHYGDTFTKQQCDEKTLAAMDEHGDRIEACVPALKTVPRKTYVAQLSLAYNIGSGGYCKSSVARHLNEGDILAACDAMLKFDKARGVTFPGLTRRRTAERLLCLEGYMEGRLGMAWRV